MANHFLAMERSGKSFFDSVQCTCVFVVVFSNSGFFHVHQNGWRVVSLGSTCNESFEQGDQCVGRSPQESHRGRCGAADIGSLEAEVGTGSC